MLSLCKCSWHCLFQVPDHYHHDRDDHDDGGGGDDDEPDDHGEHHEQNDNNDDRTLVAMTKSMIMTMAKQLMTTMMWISIDD